MVNRSARLGGTALPRPNTTYRQLVPLLAARAAAPPSWDPRDLTYSDPVRNIQVLEQNLKLVNKQVWLTQVTGGLTILYRGRAGRGGAQQAGRARASLLAAQARHALNRGQPGLCLELIGRVPGPAVRLLRCQALLQLGQPEAAMAEVGVGEQMRVGEQLGAGSLLLAATAQLRLGNFEAALVLFRRGVRARRGQHSAEQCRQGARRAEEGILAALQSLETIDLAQTKQCAKLWQVVNLFKNKNNN